MKPPPAARTPDASGSILGIECGGTRSDALLASRSGVCLARAEAGAANLRLLTDAQLLRHFRALARRVPAPACLGVGMAGAREESDRRRIRRAANRVWPGVPCWVGNDLDTALAAAGQDPQATPAPVTRVVIISGTGSCCYGRNPAGRTARVGGWGHLLGDRGSGYDIGLRACRAVVEALDQSGRWPELGARVLTALALNEPNDLVTWLHGATKADVAALAREVFAAAADRDPLARRTIHAAAQALAGDAVACARRLTAAGAVEFVLVGGVLLNQPAFARAVGTALRADFPRAEIRPLKTEGVWGAVALAKECASPTAGVVDGPAARVSRSSESARAVADPSELPLPLTTAPSPTEQRNPRSADLDRRSIESAIELMLTEDARLAGVLLHHRDQLAAALRMVVRAFRRGGRLFYVGAGTSGRLGVLDASECPPTFRTPAGMVQGIMAGGHTALWSSAEGAEDDGAAGGQAIRFRRVGAQDVVVGIAASGRTPFVWGALEAARAQRARTILLCFNPNLRFPPAIRPDLVIAPNVGAEVLTGSTRLKAGTATKLVLNILTTLSLVRLGKVVSNLMVDLNPSNAKLRDRAVGIVTQLTGADAAKAGAALEAAGWVIKSALARLGYRVRRPPTENARRGLSRQPAAVYSR